MLNFLPQYNFLKKESWKVQCPASLNDEKSPKKWQEWKEAHTKGKALMRGGG
jgi:hypothetical protein